MLVEAIKEAVASGQSLKETDSRLLAQTCVDALVGKQKTNWKNKVVAEQRANIVWTTDSYAARSSPLSARQQSHDC